MNRLTRIQLYALFGSAMVLVAGIAAAFAFNLLIVSAESNTFKQAHTELHLTQNGNINVRGAKVAAVSSTSITAILGSGELAMTFVVQTDSSTKFVKRSGASEAAADVKVGDTINFSGTLTDASPLTVKASMVKDLTLSVSGPVVLHGTVSSVNTAGNSLVVTTVSGTTTVTVSSGTLLRLNGSVITLSDIRASDRIQVMGTMNASTNIVAAEKVIVGSKDKDGDDDKKDKNGKNDKKDGKTRGFLKDLFNGNGSFKLKFN